MVSILSQITSELQKNKDVLKTKSYKKNPIKNNKIVASEENYQKYFPTAVKDEVSLIKVLGQRWKTNLQTLGSFIDIYEHVTERKYFTELYLSTTSGRLIKVYKDKMNVSRMLNKAKEIGLLCCIDDTYSFGHDKNNKCKTYIYNKKVQDLCKDVIYKYNIVIKRDIICNNSIYMSLGNTSFDEFKVRFSSKLRIAGVKKDEELLPILYKNYKDLAYYQNLADEMNKNLPAEQQIKYQPTIKKSKSGYVTKIGIRATSAVNNLKVHQNENKDYNGMWRDDYLKNFFKDEKVYEFDVTSSIYRVAYLLKTGVWLDNNIDLYKILNNGDFETKEDRDNFKSFAMRLYFDRPKQIFNHISSAVPNVIATYGEDVVKKNILAAKNRMIEVLGNGIDNEIFYHESNIYLDFVSKLRMMDIKVVQIYDGFFSNEDLSCYEDLLKGVAEEYYKKLVLPNDYII